MNPLITYLRRTAPRHMVIVVIDHVGFSWPIDVFLRVYSTRELAVRIRQGRVAGAAGEAVPVLVVGPPQLGETELLAHDAICLMHPSAPVLPPGRDAWFSTAPYAAEMDLVFSVESSACTRVLKNRFGNGTGKLLFNADHYPRLLSP